MIQVLRLLEALPLNFVTFAVTEAVRPGAITLDAVKLIARARIERRPVRLDLATYPHPPASGEDHVAIRLCGLATGDGGMIQASGDWMPTGTMSCTPQVLLTHHLKQLKLPTVLREGGSDMGSSRLRKNPFSNRL